MTPEMLLSSRLRGQFLTETADPRTAAAGLCGVQAQFLNAALHALRLRCGDADPNRSLIKLWTLRGTLHLIPPEDLPFYCLRQGTPEDAAQTEIYRFLDTHSRSIGKERAIFFAALILDAVRNGVDRKETLRTLCREAGMTDFEELHVFHPWGGTLRELCELGLICFDLTPEKRILPCPAFAPTEERKAMQELMRRYLIHYGPVTLQDAVYFFRRPKKILRESLFSLPVTEYPLGSDVFYALTPPEEGNIPPCLLLAGFDPMLLGYEKADNPILPAGHLRQVYTMTGIVHPTVLLDGRIAARWKASPKALEIIPFRRLQARERKRIAVQAEVFFPKKQVRFAEK